MQILLRITSPFTALYKADLKAFKKEVELGTIIEIYTIFPINYSKSFAKYFSFVIKFLIDFIYLRPLSSGRDILRV